MNKSKTILTLMFGLFISLGAFAQGEVSEEYSLNSIGPIAMGTLILFSFLLLFFGILLQLGIATRASYKKEGVSKLTWLQMFDDDRDILIGKYHDEVIEGHDYDGIQEFDNDLPPWWVGMFYLSVLFAVVYMAYYYVFDGKNQEQEYLTEMEDAKLRYKDIEEVYEGPSTDAALLSSAEVLYKANCVACHKADLGGGIGPNLTDAHWLYDGDVNGIFKTIKEGAANNPAMKAWKNDFDNQQIYSIASYILSKQGSNPAGAKDPEGDLWEGK